MPKSEITGFAFEHQDVRRLDVAVNHALAMGVVECLGHIGGDLDSVGDRKLVLAVEPILQRVAFHIGHHVKEKALSFAGVV